MMHNGTHSESPAVSMRFATFGLGTQSDICRSERRWLPRGIAALRLFTTHQQALPP